MRLRPALLAVAVLVTVAPVAGLSTRADAVEGLKAGAATVDATWHVGASSGQYASDGFTVGDHGIDPYQHQTRRAASYGVGSRSAVRALVVEGANGKRWGMVSTDLYIPQDLLSRRIAQIVAQHDLTTPSGATGIGEDNLAVLASHSHSSAFYSSPSWGVWVFQDVFDIRFFEYISQRGAQALIAAAADLAPASMSAVDVKFNEVNSHSYGPQIADDGTPAGAPWDYTRSQLQVVRFDRDNRRDIQWVTHAMHPEFNDGDELLSGDFLTATYRILDRETNGITIYSQSEVGTAGPHKDLRAHSAPDRREFQQLGFSQIDRASRILADGVLKGLNALDSSIVDPTVDGGWDATVEIAPTTTAEVDFQALRFEPPLTRPYPGVSNCTTSKTASGNVGIPIAGFPDCEYPFKGSVPEPVSVIGSTVYKQLKDAGVPVPDSYAPPAYTGLEEDLSVKLQVFRVGEIAVTFCPCEQFTDTALNIQTRLDQVTGNLHDGFDYSEQPLPANHPRLGNATTDDDTWCYESSPGFMRCADPRVPHPSQGTPGDLAPVSTVAFNRMKAQIHNDAAGWDAPENLPYQDTEPSDPALIKGNFTHEEFPAAGYKMVIPVSMANDYWGYMPTYRDYRSFDHYRKALSGLGAYAADFMATRLSRMAANLNDANIEPRLPWDVIADVDGANQEARALALGTIAGVHTAAYERTLPADATSTLVPYTGSVRRFEPVSIKWTGGNTYDDLPEVEIWHCPTGTTCLANTQTGQITTGYSKVADTQGEVQLRVRFPQDALELAAWRAGTFAWEWRAIWETENSDIWLPDASGNRRRQTPTDGRYAFVIRGKRRTLAGVEPYVIFRHGIQVLPWDGIRPANLSVSGGAANFQLQNGHEITYNRDAKNRDLAALFPGGYKRNVGPVDYPDRTVEFFAGELPDFPYLYESQRSIYSYNIGPGNHQLWQEYCARCSFHARADTATISSVRVTVTRGAATLHFSGTCDSAGACTVPGSFQPGDRVKVASGDVIDSFGETNQLETETVTV